MSLLPILYLRCGSFYDHLARQHRWFWYLKLTVSFACSISCDPVVEMAGRGRVWQIIQMHNRALEKRPHSNPPLHEYLPRNQSCPTLQRRSERLQSKHRAYAPSRKEERIGPFISSTHPADTSGLLSVGGLGCRCVHDPNLELTRHISTRTSKLLCSTLQ